MAGCAATGVTLRSNHFRLAVPPDWQVIEAGGGDQIPTLVRAPAKSGRPEVEMRLYPWLVSEPPADPAGDVLGRLAATNVLGLGRGALGRRRALPRPGRAVLRVRQARARHPPHEHRGQRIVVTAGESDGSLVAVVAAVGPGASGCADVANGRRIERSRRR